MAKKIVDGLRNKFGLPNEFAQGILHKDQSKDAGMGEFFLDFDPGCYLKFKHVFSDLLSHVLSESPHHSYTFLSVVNFGSCAKFSGKTQNVSPVIRELIPLIPQENDFSSYDITYHSLGPRSWKDREKDRKKLKNPTSEQVGTATLENGAVATVSLGIGKEGYVFELNFGSDDDCIKFYHSKLFQKTKWHSGAE